MGKGKKKFHSQKKKRPGKRDKGYQQLEARVLVELNRCLMAKRMGGNYTQTEKLFGRRREKGNFPDMDYQILDQATLKNQGVCDRMDANYSKGKKVLCSSSYKKKSCKGFEKTPVKCEKSRGVMGFEGMFRKK